jgi:hypothetical protein
MKAHTNYSTVVSLGGRSWRFALAGLAALGALIVALALTLRTEAPAASLPTPAAIMPARQAALPLAFADEIGATSPAEYAALGESYLPAQAQVAGAPAIQAQPRDALDAIGTAAEYAALGDSYLPAEAAAASAPVVPPAPRRDALDAIGSPAEYATLGDSYLPAQAAAIAPARQAALPLAFADEIGAPPAEYAALGDSYLPAQTQIGVSRAGAAQTTSEFAPAQAEPIAPIAGPR